MPQADRVLIRLEALPEVLSPSFTFSSSIKVVKCLLERSDSWFLFGMCELFIGRLWDIF